MHHLNTTPSKPVVELYEDLRRWLASGELKSPDGAFCAWRDADTGALAFEYPEITGYALTWLAGRESATAEELETGRRAADWMVDRLERGDRSARAGWDGGAVYTFDLGMMSAGLLSFGELLADERYTRWGRRLARGLATLVMSQGGLQSIEPTGPASSRPAEWSTQGRPHLLKCVQSLLLAGEDVAADSLIETIHDVHRGDGRFQTQPRDDKVMLHPHLYAVEGLWIWGSARNDEGALELARVAAEWAWSHRLPTGGLPRYVAMDEGVERAPEQWDVTSQALRAAVVTGARVDGIDDVARRLTTLARPAGVGCALVYQPESRNAHLNAWASMFGAQALQVAAFGAGAITWAQLV